MTQIRLVSYPNNFGYQCCKKNTKMTLHSVDWKQAHSLCPRGHESGSRFLLIAPKGFLILPQRDVGWSNHSNRIPTIEPKSRSQVPSIASPELTSPPLSSGVFRGWLLKPQQILSEDLARINVLNLITYNGIGVIFTSQIN